RSIPAASSTPACSSIRPPVHSGSRDRRRGRVVPSAVRRARAAQARGGRRLRAAAAGHDEHHPAAGRGPACLDGPGRAGSGRLQGGRRGDGTGAGPAGGPEWPVSGGRGLPGRLAALAAAGLYPPLLAVAAPLAGLCLGPTLATLFSGAASAAP